MLKSRIEFKNNRPLIWVNGTTYSPLAYTTYFDECGEFSDFIKNGYKMFFVNVSFTDLPINNMTGFTPFRVGVFESEEPDYSEFENCIDKILGECPDAMIFPRINISMPRKWTEEHPDETVQTLNGGARESMFSDIFLRDGTELLKTLVSHIRSSYYSENIVGYQLCGGTTQEWMHHDCFGSFSPLSIAKYHQWLMKKYGISNAEAPQRKDFDSCIISEKISRYGEFCCEKNAETVEHFCKALKEYINNEQIVGVFYGYNAFVNDYLLGLHALGHIINSPYIDFFSSPNCYDNNRFLGIDWGDMIPVDSLKIHEKLCFIECDIRTHLTKKMQSSRPGEYPENILPMFDNNGNKTVWNGPDTPELSLSAIRKSFAHQLTKASGIWWFDMWGGWYHDEAIMTELSRMKDIADSAGNKNTSRMPAAETVFFIDEKAYTNIARGNHLLNSVNNTRVAMGNTGIPYDLCMVEDADKILPKYKTAIFSAPVPSDDGKKAIEMCKKLSIPYICTSPDKPFFDTSELRNFLTESGIHCYNSDGCVIYVGYGFLGIHSVNDGKVHISLPAKYRVKGILGTSAETDITDTFCIDIKKHDTVLFELF